MIDFYKRRTGLIYLLLFFLSACEEPPKFELTNTQDPGSDDFIAPPDSVTVGSYDDNSIIFHFVTADIDSILLERQDLYDSLSFSAALTGSSSYFIDSVDVIPNIEYSYFIRFSSALGQSTPTFVDSFSHDFPAADSFTVNQLNESTVELNWYYCYSNHFEKDVDSIEWQIEKYFLNGPNTGDTLTIDTVLQVSSDCHYGIVDTVELGDSLQYQVQLKTPHNLSEIKKTDPLRVTFPNVSDFGWIPINSSTIFLSWSLDNVSSGYLESVFLKNNLSGGDILFSDTTISAMYIDNVAEYYTTVEAGQSILYTLKWCGQGGTCDSSEFVAATFPIYNMEYIPSISNFPFGTADNEITVGSSDAFYIDIYEVSDFLYSNPEVNSSYLQESIPKDSLDFWQARQFTNDRSVAVNQFIQAEFDFEDTYDNPSYDESYDSVKVGFHIANELEWEIAASCRFDFFSGTFQEKLSYPESVGSGELSCTYANILGCFGYSTPVGFYNGENYPYLESRSPSGLYDVCGNLKEWVEKYFNHDDNRVILKGGDYLSSAAESKTTSFIYENGSVSHKTIGFRTAIRAEPFLEHWYEWISNE